MILRAINFIGKMAYVIVVRIKLNPNEEAG